MRRRVTGPPWRVTSSMSANMATTCRRSAPGVGICERRISIGVRHARRWTRIEYPRAEQRLFLAQVRIVPRRILFYRDAALRRGRVDWRQGGPIPRTGYAQKSVAL